MPFADRLNGWIRAVPVWPSYIVAALPPVWLLQQGLSGGLGADPVKVMEHQLGLWGLQLLIATLCVSPIRNIFWVNLIRFRRPLGRIAFAYIFLHLLVWLVLDVQILGQIWNDILKRPCMTVGMAGFLLLIPLIATSNDWSLRKLGALAWRRLHKLIYGAVLLGGLHFLMLVKGFQWEPILYLGGIAALLLLKASGFKRKKHQKRVAQRA